MQKDKYHFITRFKVGRTEVKDVPDSDSAEKNCIEITEVDEVFLLSSSTPEAKSELLAALHDAIDKRVAVLKEQEEHIDRVAAPKAATAAAILSSHYEKLKRNKTRPLSMSGCNLEDAEKKTFFNMPPEEKWKIANEARDALKGLSFVSELNNGNKKIYTFLTPFYFFILFFLVVALKSRQTKESLEANDSSTATPSSRESCPLPKSCNEQGGKMAFSPASSTLSAPSPSISPKFVPRQLPQRYSSKLPQTEKH